MRTTIDRAGRLVVPKPIRDRLHIGAGAEVDVDEHDGVIEVRPVLAETRIVQTPEGPVVESVEPLPPLTDDVVRHTLESIRE